MENSLIGKTVYVGGKKPEEKTIEQKRGDILEAKLTLLNEYITDETLSPSGKSFTDFLKENNITKEEFIKGLPNGLNKPNLSDLESVTKYAEKLNKEYFKQYLIYTKDKGEGELSANGVVDGDYTPFPADGGTFLNGDGMGYIPAADNPDNWVEAVTYGTASEAALRNALKRAYYFINEYGRQLEEKLGENDTVNAEYIGRRLDDVASIVDWLTKRLEGNLTAYDAGHAFAERHAYDMALMASNDKSPKPKGAFNKLKAELQKVADITKQNWHSIGVGLGKSPAEIFRDIKNEVQKSVTDVKANTTVALNILNKLNPVAVAGRASLLGLIDINAFGLATHFNVLRRDTDLWPKALQKWSSLGGNPADFSAAITKGKDKKRLFEGAIVMVNRLKNIRNADGSFNASAEEIQKALEAAAQAQKDYDEAVKKNKTTNIAAIALGTVAASTGAIGGLMTSGVLGPQAVTAGPAVVAGGGTLASFIPVINQLKVKVGEKPDGRTPEANPIVPPTPGEDPVPPTPGEDPVAPTSNILKSSTTKWVVGTIVVAGLGIGIYKYATR